MHGKIRNLSFWLRPAPRSKSSLRSLTNSASRTLPKKNTVLGDSRASKAGQIVRELSTNVCLRRGWRACLDTLAGLQYLRGDKMCSCRCKENPVAIVAVANSKVRAGDPSNRRTGVFDSRAESDPSSRWFEGAHNRIERRNTVLNGAKPLRVQSAVKAAPF